MFSLVLQTQITNAEWYSQFTYQLTQAIFYNICMKKEMVERKRRYSFFIEWHII